MDFSRTTVLCIGDLMLDEFLSGEVSRISPEAPVPILRLKDSRTMLGGVGNVSRNVCALGGRAVLVGLIGQDHHGDTVRHLVSMTPHLVDAVVSSSLRPTTRKRRYSAVNQQVLRVDDEFAFPARPREVELLKSRIAEHISAAHAVILSDYGKGTLPRELIEFVIAEANARPIPVFIDPKSNDFSLYAGATCVTPNLGELAAACGTRVDTEEEIVALARGLLAKNNLQAMLVTRSADGMTLIEANGDFCSAQARALEVFDVSGAGDTAIATFALACASGENMVKAMQAANAAAGIVVGKVGTATLGLRALLDALDDGHQAAGTSNNFLLDAASAVALVDRWKRRGLTVGFTNGCFDILHVGHVSLLSQARAQCNKLIVGLNTDDSIARLKGPSRPYNMLSDRAGILSGLKYVDAVTAFEENTPRGLIEMLRPDVLIKGADYKLDDVVGADVVQMNGGRVFLAKFVHQRSTTRLINGIRNAS